MSRLKNGPDLDRELLAAIRAFAKADAGLSKVILLPLIEPQCGQTGPFGQKTPSKWRKAAASS